MPDTSQYVILPDADLGAAADNGMASRLINSGQSWIAAKRFIVNLRMLHAAL